MSTRWTCRSVEEWRELQALRRLELEAEAELRWLTVRLEDCGARQAAARRRLVEHVHV